MIHGNAFSMFMMFPLSEISREYKSNITYALKSNSFLYIRLLNNFQHKLLQTYASQ